jgi:hypothetical protein
MPAQCALLPTKPTTAPADAACAGDRLELGEQLSTQGLVAEPGRGGRHPADEQRPQVGAVVAPGADGGHGVQGAARGVEVAGFAGQGEQPGGARVRSRGNPHNAPDHFGGGGPQLVWQATGTRQHQQLTRPDVHGIGLADPFTQRARLVDQLPGLVEPPVDQRECAAAGQGHVVVAGLAEPLGEVEVLGQGGPERRRAGLEQGSGGEQHALGVPLRVCGARGQICDLPGQIDPLRGAARCPQHIMAREQARAQGGRVAELARQPQGVLRQRPGPGTVLRDGVGQLPGQARGELCLQRHTGAVQRPEGGLEQGDDVVAGHREPRAELEHAERDPPEPFGVTQRLGPACGLVQQLACLGRIPGPRPGIGLLEEQVDERPAGLSVTGVLDRPAGPGQVPASLGERQSCPLSRGRRAGPADRPLSTA